MRSLFTFIGILLAISLQPVMATPFYNGIYDISNAGSGHNRDQFDRIRARLEGCSDIDHAITRQAADIDPARFEAAADGPPMGRPIRISGTPYAQIFKPGLNVFSTHTSTDSHTLLNPSNRIGRQSVSINSSVLVHADQT